MPLVKRPSISSIVHTLETNGLEVVNREGGRWSDAAFAIARYNNGGFFTAVLHNYSCADDIENYSGDLEIHAYPPRRRGSIPYPEYLPLPQDLTAAYDLSILTPEVRSALAEVGSRTIRTTEVKTSDDVTQTTQPIRAEYQPKSRQTYLKLRYVLQRPSREHSKCIAGVHRGMIDPKMLPYHQWQEQRKHYCIPGGIKEFPLLPFDFEKLSRNFALELDFGNATDEKRRQLLSGLQLPFHSRINFTGARPHERLFMVIKDGKRPDGEVDSFTLFLPDTDLEEGVGTYFPHFLRIYDTFTKI